MFSRAIVVLISLVSVQAFAADRVHMVLEQDLWGHVSHRAADLPPLGEGLDPVFQFVLLQSPNDPDIAQVLWIASETPIPWVRGLDDQPYRFVEHAALPENSRIEYRVYSEQAGFEYKELRHEVTTEDLEVSIDFESIESLPNGRYNLMARLRVPDRPMQVITQRIDVVDSMDEIIQFEELDEEPGAAPPPPVPLPGDAIVPGNGWNRKTTVPGQVGNSHEPTIAHWNVVPEQQIEDGFTVGVIAHHLDGIDYVEISANDGPWIRIDQPSINPRTQCVEYWSPLDLRGHNGPVELRAIAVPKAGKPVLVVPQGDAYSKQDLTLHTDKVGAVIELGAGTHQLPRRALPETGWLIVRAKDGLTRDQVIIDDVGKDWMNGRLKFEGVTLKLDGGGSQLRGNWATRKAGQHIWFDDCRIIGNGPKDQTWWLACFWESGHYTGCQISDVQTAFYGMPGIIRNCYVHDVYEDTFRGAGLHVNITIEDVDRQPLKDAQPGFDAPHPDIWQSQALRNLIAQDIIAVKNINAQGFFPKVTQNVALVRVNVKSVSPYRAIQMMGKTSNVLVEDCKFQGGANFRGSVLPGERLIFRDTVAGNAPPFLPHGWEAEGIHVFPRPVAAE